MSDQYGKVPSSPTIPGRGAAKPLFDLASLYEDPEAGSGPAQTGLDEKLRKAYYWITNYAIISPFYDIEYHDGPSRSFSLGDSKAQLRLPSGVSWSSFVLLPLLSLVTRRRCLFIGGPGRGKTASAILMGVIAGYKMKDIKRAIQHGQPQMTIADLLGNPIPSDLMKSETMEDIRIAWRKWLGMRVKIIDEYNRIPTRTQSALLTVMADGYAELMDQVFDCPESAWYLTANDDAGGGTYQVIEALKDRIDVVVHALHFNSRFLGELLTRIEAGVRPEESVPSEIVFSQEEMDLAYQEILETALPEPLLRRLEYFAAQFEFFEPAGEQFEYRTKDGVKLAGVEMSSLSAQETGKDKLKDLGLQTKNGLSVRALMTAMVYLKATAWFRGNKEVDLEDMRNILPFVFHDKLAQNPDSPFFDQEGNAIYRVDRLSWIRKLFDLSCDEYNARGLDKQDATAELSAAFERGLTGLTEAQVRSELGKIEKRIEEIAAGRKIHGPAFDEILKLKYLHQRYSNYLRWLKSGGA